MKQAFICILLCLLILCGCSSETSSVETCEQDESSAQDEAYSIGYDKGYEDGIKYALSQLRDGAVDWKIYMDIEDVDDSIHAYLKDFPDIDCCDVRDMIIYNSDFEHYSLEDLLENLIAENMDEP